MNARACSLIVYIHVVFADNGVNDFIMHREELGQRPLILPANGGRGYAQKCGIVSGMIGGYGSFMQRPVSGLASVTPAADGVIARNEAGAAKPCGFSRSLSAGPNQQKEQFRQMFKVISIDALIFQRRLGRLWGRAVFFWRKSFASQSIPSQRAKKVM